MATLSERRKVKRARTFKHRIIGLVAIVLILVSVVVVYQLTSSNPSAPVAAERVLLATSKGSITIELYDYMPITAGNFKNLTKRGTYDGVIFHRVIDGFMIQGGDPTGTGLGDPNIPTIPDEFSSNATRRRNDRGTVAMANRNDETANIFNTGSSQFFINLVDNNYLDGKHPVFGRVVAGMDVVDAIGKVPVDASNKPLQDVKIIKAEVVS